MTNARPQLSGATVDDAEHLYRAILYPLQWAEGQDRPSTAAFDEEVFSVDIASRTTPDRTKARFRFVLKLVEFNCGQARRIGFETRDERDPSFPENDAHANVYFLDYQATGESQRKKKARRLAELCRIVAE